MAQLPTFNNSVTVATVNTFQAISLPGQPMRSLTIQNNNAGGNVWLEVSGLVTTGMTLSSAVTVTGQPASTAAKVSMLLMPGQSYCRYAPNLPTGPIVGTSDTAANSIYVDWQ
jgi:hypothetical protein